jgi:hypothetical protein
MRKAVSSCGSLMLAIGLFALVSCESDSSGVLSSSPTTATRDAEAIDPADGGSVSVNSPDSAGVSMPKSANVSVALSVGPFASCVIDDQRSVHCFGMCGPSGQGGMRNTAPAGLKARAVAVGRAFACALLAEVENGTVLRCWGGDPAGATPKIVEADEIAAAETHACVRNGSGRVTCWGTMSADGGATPAVPADLVAKHIAVSGSMDCAIVVDDSVRCWGSRPVAPPADLKAKRIAVSTQLADPNGGPRYGCAVTTSDDVRCWGDDPGGVQTIPSGIKAKDIAVGRSAACALGLDGHVTCWGVEPKYGANPPQDRKATALSMAFRTAAAVLEDHTFSFWGDLTDERGSLPAGVKAP